jgi:MerR family transcriptional regulator, copper efflux regulator
LTLESVPAFIIALVTKRTSQNSALRSGQLARLTGVSTDTLRHYEQKGLLESRRSSNGYREYSPHCVDRVRLIRNALAIGFGLDDLAAILKIRDSGGAPCRQVRAMAEAKFDELETRLREMTMLRDEMRRLLGDWDQRLESVDPNQPARLLESLSNGELSGARTRLRARSLSPKRNLQREKK